MAWKTSSCIGNIIQGTASGLDCTKPAFLAVEYMFLLPFMVWIFLRFFTFADFSSSFPPLSLNVVSHPGFWPKEAGQNSLEGQGCNCLFLQQCLVNMADRDLCTSLCC